MALRLHLLSATLFAAGGLALMSLGPGWAAPLFSFAVAEGGFALYAALRRGESVSRRRPAPGRTR